MKTTPILFSTQMVHAIQSGRKTMTRRIVDGTALEWLQPEMFTPEFVANPENNLCRFGQPGDILWVRETWQHTQNFGIHPSDDNSGYIYKASENGKDWQTNTEGWQWKPSIFMPKAACRIFLKITGIKAERLHDITESDAIAEGARHFIERNTPCLIKDTYPTAIQDFEALWQKINGYSSWDANPWVWAISSEKVEKPEGFA